MEELLQTMCAAAVLLNPIVERRGKSLESKVLRILAPCNPCSPSLSRCPWLIQLSILCRIYRPVCRHQCHEIVAGGHRQLTFAMMSYLLIPLSLICASMSEDLRIVAFAAPGMDVVRS
ncbi:hypothetical protein BDR07DRAFT_1400306 [Suillus spraguei]|nr:hypothetical protein BDR07DRAFT_1400306 [Suillus spraguei]